MGRLFSQAKRAIHSTKKVIEYSLTLPKDPKGNKKLSTKQKQAGELFGRG